MKEITLDMNGQFKTSNYIWTIDIVKRDDKTYFQLYRDGCEFIATSDVDLECCCGIIINNIDEFREVLHITLEDDWGNSAFKANIPEQLVHSLYNKWKGDT